MAFLCTRGDLGVCSAACLPVHFFSAKVDQTGDIGGRGKF